MEKAQSTWIENLADNLNRITGVYAKVWSSPDGHKNRIYLNLNDDWLKKYSPAKQQVK